jgi:hypothetical protein
MDQVRVFALGNPNLVTCTEVAPASNALNGGGVTMANSAFFLRVTKEYGTRGEITCRTIFLLYIVYSVTIYTPRH